MSRNLVVAALACALLPLTVGAAERNMTYTFAEFGYADLDYAGDVFADSVDDEELSAGGLYLAAGYELSDMLFLTSTYHELTGSGDISARSRSFGAGLAFGLGDRTDIYVTASYLRTSLTHDALDDSGVDAELGLRRLLGARTEIFGLVGYSSLFEESGTRAGLGARYWFNDGFALGVTAQDSDFNGSGVTLTGRFNF